MLTEKEGSAQFTIGNCNINIFILSHLLCIVRLKFLKIETDRKNALFHPCCAKWMKFEATFVKNLTKFGSEVRKIF